MRKNESGGGSITTEWKPGQVIITPSGSIVRLRRGSTKNEQLLLALSATCQPFDLAPEAEDDVQILIAIERGELEVM